MTLEEAVGFKRDAVSEALGGLPPQKVHSSVLVEDAVKDSGKNLPIKPIIHLPFWLPFPR